MPASLAAIRQALVDALSTIDGLNVLGYQPEQPPVPCAVVFRSGGSPRSDFGRTTPVYTFEVRVVASRADAIAAQQQLDLFVERGTGWSVWDALEVDPTLGGVVQTIRCGDVTGDQQVQVGDVTYLGCDFTVTVHP